MLPGAIQVADPFHVCKLANHKLDEVRRRVQNETLGHRGHKDDPLYRCRRLLTRADERLDDKGRNKLLSLLKAGDPHGEVRTAWHAKELVRQLYSHTDPETGLAWVTQLGHDLQDDDCPPEINQLGRTLIRWRHQIAAWHHAHISNGPTENQNGLIKRIKRVSVYRPSQARCRMIRDWRIGTGETAIAGRPGGWQCESNESRTAFESSVNRPSMSSWRISTCRTWRSEPSLR